MIVVAGDGRLAYVTAASVAQRGNQVTLIDTSGLEFNEPGLDALISQLHDIGVLSSSDEARPDYRSGDIVWICYDTPVDATGAADVEWVWDKIRRILATAPIDTMVLISSQVPVGFATEVQELFPHLRIISAPENIRRGTALADFWTHSPALGANVEVDRERIAKLFDGAPILWMSLESAEMSKHMLNAFLATCIVFANEINSIAHAVGADYDDMLRATRRDSRVAQTTPLRAGSADGRHLLRDINYLLSRGQPAPLLSSLQIAPIWES
jgi:UDPglucose 6-dehydrogenase